MPSSTEFLIIDLFVSFVELPNRSHPYPKGEEWKIISQIDWDIDYETD